MKTYMHRTAQVKRNWHLVDAKGRVLGQVASEIAVKLMGKDKITYTPHIDDGDYVVVINSSEVVVTGRKNERKEYHHHSLFPGGLTTLTFAEMQAKHPGRVIEEAVKNMLPKNRLRKDRMARLKVYATAQHSHQSQLGNKE
jgi:large subunit ribosomal protein L13